MKSNNKIKHLEHIRHSLAHLLAAAVLELYPDAQRTIGPAIDNGFYFDFDNLNISDDDLPKIEKKMRDLFPSWNGFNKVELSKKEALEHYPGNPYKAELIEEFSKEDDKLSFYESGEGYRDLCRGGHVENMQDIDPKAFKLTHTAGAYWRGDEKNKMLTRIYGLAFETKKELDEYLAMQEEAKKRDHKKLGKELGLFVFSDVVGKGLPLWTEKGTTIRRELERFIVDEEIKRGYQHVYTPDIAKLDLYEKSGHYPYYKDSMYAPIEIDDERFMLRPMTCPHHFELYLSSPHSYRDLPMRIAEVAKLYRYEQSGELSGLQRVRSFCLADAHIVCANPKQAAEEVNGALDLIEHINSVFGFVMGEDYWYRLSLGDRSDEKKYFKDDAAWDEAEALLRDVLKKRKVEFVESENEAAFYGPKIDIQMRNVNGKEDTAFTVQYDFVFPKRFDITYKGKDGKDHEAVIVHRSSIGAIERVVAFLIEHYAGAFPLWLSPVQVKILPIAESHIKYAEEVFKKLKDQNIRVEIDDSSETLGKKIRNWKLEKVPYAMVIGDDEVKSGKIKMENRDGKPATDSIEKLLEKLQKDIKERK